MPKSHVITFYSYKGGSGRSTTLVNTVMHLKNELHASYEQPILIVDADLESAGLTYFFNCEKKFTKRFPEAIHTGKILNDAADVLESDSGQVVFGRENDKEGPVPADVLEMYDSLVFGSSKPSALLNGIVVPGNDIKMFKKIIESHKKTNDQGLPEEGSFEKYVNENYNITALVNTFIDIESQAAFSEKEKRDKIRAEFLNFLPSRKIIDVSEFFDAEAGTIFFIGADVSNDESLARGGSARAINLLRLHCDHHGFQAIVFDSSAGTQSSADILHDVSDAIVYCMRPTQQFLKGTKVQLWNYRGKLEKQQAKKHKNDSNDKQVILLPTAVPAYDEGTSFFQNDSFSTIKGLVESFSALVDGTFCDPSSCLHEVPLFKWREHILGAPLVSGDLDEDLRGSMEVYSGNGEMPDDAKEALKVYKKLAERIRINL